MIIDSHAHLNDEKIINDITNIISRMKANGVLRVLVPGWDKESSKLSVKLSNEYDEIYGAVGIHPENVEGIELSDLDEIKELTKNKKIVAIGEVGLDYHWTAETKDKQKEFFIKQIALSYELNLPLVIHLRDATEDCINILKENIKIYGKRENMGVMHSFSGSVETMNECLKMGFYISFSGPVTYKNARTIKEAALTCPMDRILVETDSPYLPPVPLRGTINEPKNVVYILNEIANIKGIDVKTLEEETTKNFNRLFLGE